MLVVMVVEMTVVFSKLIIELYHNYLIKHFQKIVKKDEEILKK
jgi:hypothetical protein